MMALYQRERTGVGEIVYMERTVITERFDLPP